MMRGAMSQATRSRRENVMQLKIMLAISSLALSLASSWSAEAQTHVPMLAPFEPQGPVYFDVSYTADCFSVPFNIVWRTRDDRSVITHMSLGSTKPSEAQLARFNSWVGRLRGELAMSVACDGTGAAITFISLSDYDNKHEVQFDWIGTEDRLLLVPEVAVNGDRDSH